MRTISSTSRFSAAASWSLMCASVGCTTKRGRGGRFVMIWITSRIATTL
jgi:hypothetical protein